MVETCPNCGTITNVRLGDMVQDLFFPNKTNYKCPKCGQYNKMLSRKNFVNPGEFKHFVPTQQTFIDKPITNRPENNFDSIKSTQLMRGNPFAPILEGFEKKHAFESELDIERHKQRKHAKTPGSSWTNCPHLNIVTKNGITYCTSCGRNFNTKALANIGYYNTDDFSSINVQLDNAIDDIFAQEPDYLKSEEEALKNRGRGRPHKNPFVFDEKDMSITPFSSEMD